MAERVKNRRQIRVRKVKCPHCDTLMTQQMEDSVSATSNKRSALLSGKFFELVCPKCLKTSRHDYPTVYINFDSYLLPIYWAEAPYTIEDADHTRAVRDSLVAKLQDAKKLGYKKRHKDLFTHKEFVEAISIIDEPLLSALEYEYMLAILDDKKHQIMLRRREKIGKNRVVVRTITGDMLKNERNSLMFLRIKDGKYQFLELSTGQILTDKFESKPKDFKKLLNDYDGIWGKGFYNLADLMYQSAMANYAEGEDYDSLAAKVKSQVLQNRP